MKIFTAVPAAPVADAAAEPSNLPSAEPGVQLRTDTYPPGHDTPANRTWLALLVIVLLALPLFFYYLGGWGFFDPDEGRYAEIPREMLVHHDFITPTLNYVQYFEKPPLLYWLTAAAFKVFGYHEWAGRLVPSLSALCGLFIAYGLGRRMFGPRGGFLGAVILATSLMWPIMARVLVIDTLVSVLIFLALACWWWGHTETQSQSRQTWFFISFWIALALGVLAKGPVAVALVGASIFLYLLLCRQWRGLAAMRWTIGVPLFVVVAAPWFILIAQRHPAFNHFFWYGQNVGRFLGQGKNAEHVKPFYYFLIWMPAVIVPWSAFVPGAIAVGWDKIWPARSDKQRAFIFLLCAAGCITLFFSASAGKLLAYILPVLPMWALLLAAYFDWLFAHPRAAWRWPLVSGVALLSLVLGVGAILGIAKGPQLVNRIEALNGSIAIILSVLSLLWVAAMITATLRRHLSGLVVAVSGGFTVFFTSAMVLLVAGLAPNHYGKSLVAYIEPGLRAGGELVMYKSYMQSVGFYTQRRLQVNSDPGELEFGRTQLSPAERRLWFPTGGLKTVRQQMSKTTPVYCFMPDHKTARQAIKELNGAATEIIWNKRRSIIGNKAALALTPPKPGGWLGRDSES